VDGCVIADPRIEVELEALFHVGSGRLQIFLEIVGESSPVQARPRSTNICPFSDTECYFQMLQGLRAVPFMSEDISIEYFCQPPGYKGFRSSVPPGSLFQEGLCLHKITHISIAEGTKRGEGGIDIVPADQKIHIPSSPVRSKRGPSALFR